MSELISRSALLDDMQMELEKAVNSEDMTEFECKVLMTSALALKGFVNRQPTIEAVGVVHGEWIMRGGKTYCSKCGKLALRDQDRDNWWYYVQSNFCPNCGADMRKGGAE